MFTTGKLKMPLKIHTGEAVQLHCNFSKEGVRFQSSNADIASVLQSGKVIANGPGYVEISACKGEVPIAVQNFEVVPGDTAYPVLYNRYQRVERPVGRLCRLDNTKWTVNRQELYASEVLLKDFYRMCSAARAEDVKLLALNAYRSVSDQMETLAAYTKRLGEADAKKRCAPPRFSEHHTGLAIDISGGYFEDGKFIFKPTKAYEWVGDHCHEYGFMIKNLPGKEHITGTVYEPWHIRYLGDYELAKLLHERALTLDEYLDETVCVTRQVEIYAQEDPAFDITAES